LRKAGEIVQAQADFVANPVVQNGHSFIKDNY
jgi:hypothetical protein